MNTENLKTETIDAIINKTDLDENEKLFLIKRYMLHLMSEEDAQRIIRARRKRLPSFKDEAVRICEAGLYDAAVELMDDDIRETLRAAIAPCEDVTFLTSYMAAHYWKYNEQFSV